MTISTDYRVHSANLVQAPALAMVDGEPMHATVNTFEVELVSLEGKHGTVTKRFRGSASEEAQQLFKPDAIITCTFTAKPTVAMPNAVPKAK